MRPRAPDLVRQLAVAVTWTAASVGGSAGSARGTSSPLVCRVLVDRPPDGAIPAANRLRVPDGLHKSIRVGRIDSVIDLDADTSLAGSRDEVEVRLGPVAPTARDRAS